MSSSIKNNGVHKHHILMTLNTYVAIHNICINIFHITFTTHYIQRVNGLGVRTHISTDYDVSSKPLPRLQFEVVVLCYIDRSVKSYHLAAIITNKIDTLTINNRLLVLYTTI